MDLVVCPHCKNKIELRFENLFWTDDEEVFYKCQSCGTEIMDTDRSNMLLNMECEHLKDLKSPIPNLFNALYSPFISLTEIMQEFKQSRNDEKKIKNLIKYWLGQKLEEEKNEEKNLTANC